MAERYSKNLPGYMYSVTIFFPIILRHAMLLVIIVLPAVFLFQVLFILLVEFANDIE